MGDVKRVVNTALWDDDLVLEKFSAEDKYFMLFLLTNKYTTQLGIYYFPVKKVAIDMGYSVESVYSLLERFEYKYDLVRFSLDTKEIAIKNYLRHSIVKGGKPVLDCLKRDTESVKDKSLIDYVINHLSNCDIKNDTVKEYINYIKNNTEKNIYINDNDNEDSSTNRPRIVESRKEKEPKHQFGKYKNVLLTDKEYDKLALDYGAEKRDKAIEYLDMYIPDKGYSSKSHNMAIRRWVMDAISKKSASKTESFVDKWTNA